MITAEVSHRPRKRELAAANTTTELANDFRFFRLRNNDVNLLIRQEEDSLIVFSMTVWDKKRGQGLIWEYLEKVGEEARRRGLHYLKLDGTLITPRLREKAELRGFTVIGSSAAIFSK